MFDYVSQWYPNSNEVMAMYRFETLNGALSFPLVTTIANRLGLIAYPADAIVEALRNVWGSQYDRFVGLVANLLFDFGYVGTTFLGLTYAWLVRSLQPARSGLSFGAFLVLGPMFALPAAGFTSSLMNTVGFNLVVLYSVTMYSYLSPKADGRQAEDRRSTKRKARDRMCGSSGHPRPLKGAVHVAAVPGAGRATDAWQVDTLSRSSRLRGRRCEP
jgi:hypothetical protein